MSCKSSIKIKLAPESGFCFGVRRAIDLAEKALAEDQQVYSLGPIIHNPQEVQRLKEQGLRVVERLDEIESGTLVIRSHGLAPKVVSAAKEKGLKIVDATCPLVSRAQKIAETLTKEGYTVVIIGDAHHPEVAAICQLVPQAKVVTTSDDLPRDAGDKKIGVLAQTTESPERFRQAVQGLADREFEEIRVYNTICPGTVRRERAAVELAGQVDIMFVLGGRNSANTKRLVQMCRQAGVPTYHLEHFGELAENSAAKSGLTNCRQIGITAGASTPDWLIRRFIEQLARQMAGST